MTVKLLTDPHLEFLSLKGGCTGSSESTHVKMPHCWKSHATAHIVSYFSTSRDVSMGGPLLAPRTYEVKFLLVDKESIAIACMAHN